MGTPKNYGVAELPDRANSDRVPQLRDELNRKSFETVEWLFTALDGGRITKEQFSTGIDALFMAVNGLANADVTELMTEADYQLRNEVVEVRRAFMSGSTVVSMRWTVGETTVSVTTYRNGLYYKRATKPYETAKAARAALDQFETALIAKGYLKL